MNMEQTTMSHKHATPNAEPGAGHHDYKFFPWGIKSGFP